MVIKKGIGVSPGVAIAEALVLDSGQYKIRRKYIHPEQVEGELERLDRAIESAQEEVSDFVEQQKRDNPEIHRIIETHLAFLQDEEIRSGLVSGVKEHGFTPEYAVSRVMGRYIKVFENMQDGIFSTRFSDLHDVEKRLLKHLLGGKEREDLSGITETRVIVARDLTPTQTAALDTSMVAGFATEVGGQTSHTAIVAKSLGIPAVVGIGKLVKDVSVGDLLIIDGTEGVVLINPDEDEVDRYREKSRSFGIYEEIVTKDSALPAVSTDGTPFTVLGNIEFPWEIKNLVKGHADGVGLFRTEFLYLDSLARATSEEAHYEIYSNMVSAVLGQVVTIRTLDLGSDKSPPDFGVGMEANPALGCRSLRFSFVREDLFVTQLRAILRASVNKNVKLMFPLVTSVAELRRARGILSRTMDELRKEGIPFNEDIPVGIMVEVPSAVLIADSLAKEVDFFSIGSNDLIQYALAVDRVNERVAHLYEPAHPAILRLLKMTIDAAAKAEIEVSLCGEMATDPKLAVLLVGLGLTRFSVTPGDIPELKKVLRSVAIVDAKKVAEAALTLATAEEVLNHLKAEVPGLLPRAPY